MPAGLFEQSRYEPLPLRPHRRQTANKALGLICEGGLPLAPQRFTGGVPSALHVPPGLFQFELRRLNGSACFAQLRCRSFDPVADVRGCPALGRTEDAIGFPRPRFTANEAWRCIG
jgi:hypothetical protein